MRSDEQLAAAACAGEKSAFAELVDRYRDRLYRFMLTRCASPADAEDAVQDAFVNAYRYLDSFDQRWRFSTWIYRIGIRAAQRLSSDVPAGESEIADPDADPLAACIRSSSRDNLWVTAKGLLSEEAYAALWLRYVEDMSIRDVAAALDRSTSWAKVTLMRSRQRLAEALDENARPAREGGAYG